MIFLASGLALLSWIGLRTGLQSRAFLGLARWLDMSNLIHNTWEDKIY